MAKYGAYKYGTKIKYGLLYYFKKFLRILNIPDALWFKAKKAPLKVINLDDTLNLATVADRLMLKNVPDGIVFKEVK